MGRALKIISLWTILGVAIVSQADTPSSPHITVIVRYPAALPEASIVGAERPAARIFEKAGVPVRWRNCPELNGAFPDPSCAGPLTPTDLVVHIAAHPHKATDAVFGTAFLNPEGGVYADVFLDRVLGLREQDRSISLPRLLGCVLAHEIGHLLLGEHSHSRNGLMQAQWQFEQLRKIARGNLLFDSKEAAQLRTRVAALSERSTNVEIESFSSAHIPSGKSLASRKGL
jgi:hypothetical protein